MSIEYGSRGLVGLLTPQANTTVEPEFWSMLPPGFSAINGRMTSACASIEARLVDYFERLEASCEQFANAPVGCLAVACTGASYLVGREREAELISAIERRHGVPLFTAATSVVAALTALGARRIGLSSPYPEGLSKASVAYWSSQGFEVAAISSATTDDSQFHPIYSIPADAAARTLAALNRPDIDAIVMLGTGMPTLGPIAALADWSGPPVLSCMLALGWRCISALAPELAPMKLWTAEPHWKARLDMLFPTQAARV
jgi:maleate cis-trans isomerase